MWGLIGMEFLPFENFGGGFQNSKRGGAYFRFWGTAFYWGKIWGRMGFLHNGGWGKNPPQLQGVFQNTENAGCYTGGGNPRGGFLQKEFVLATGKNFDVLSPGGIICERSLW